MGHHVKAVVPIIRIRYEKLCQDEPRETCVPKEKCKSWPKKNCGMVHKEACLPFPTKKSTEISKPVCRIVPRQECTEKKHEICETALPRIAKRYWSANHAQYAFLDLLPEPSRIGNDCDSHLFYTF